MASLPSGSREDVELVKIETDYCSLVIKGKPFHERYEGLKQYKGMNFHERMEFQVEGEGVRDVQVFDVNQEKLCHAKNVRPIFFENGVYLLIVIPKEKKELTFYHEYPVLRKAVSYIDINNQVILLGNLHFQNEVGYSTFEIQFDQQPILKVTLEIFPTKLDYRKDYQKILDEVNNEIYNLAFHFIRKTYLGSSIKQEQHPSRAEFFRLITKHFSRFLDAVLRIEHQPHHVLQKSYEKARGDQLGKIDTYSRNYLRKHPNLFVQVDQGVSINNKNMMPTYGLRIKKELTYNTIENRYVKWMMERLIYKLTDLIGAIIQHHKKWKKKPDPVLLNEIESMKKKLKHKLNQPFWKRIGDLDRSVMSLVLQMAPGYREAFRIYLTVSKGLMLRGKLYQMSVKDVATLYEYWTYLKIGQILSRNYKLISQNIVQVNREGLFVNLEKNRKAQRVYQHPLTNEKIVLTFQKYERNLPTIPQKPDTMLSIEKKGRNYTFQYIFDAKYRIDYAQIGSSYHSRYKYPGPMEEDINTMHRYRDSIVATKNHPYVRTAFGAYVLFPWSFEEEYVNHHFYKSINEVNIGALPFLPNATRLVERFLERLIDKSPEELQQEGILPQGALDEWQSSIDEKVLVGLVSTKEEYEHFIKECVYHLPISHLKSGWQQAKYIALYVKQGLQLKNGVVVYGKINEVVPTQSVIKFNVESWKNCQPIIKPVNYGIACYMITTLQQLLEAKELPELFMKSKQERTIWRMLRRLSDQIKVSLDANMVDDATKIEAYKMKDLSVTMNKAEQRLIIYRGDRCISFPFSILEKNPSAIFKEIVQLIQT